MLYGSIEYNYILQSMQSDTEWCNAIQYSARGSCTIKFITVYTYTVPSSVAGYATTVLSDCVLQAVRHLHCDYEWLWLWVAGYTTPVMWLYVACCTTPVEWLCVAGSKTHVMWLCVAWCMTPVGWLFCKLYDSCSMANVWDCTTAVEWLCVAGCVWQL